MEEADLVNADLTKADLRGANLASADLRRVNLAGVLWKDIGSVEKANVYGVRNAPEGFVAWAMQYKAVSVVGDDQ
jgi:uncharacterized protein YjbI with pentapeptide repeats